MQLSEVRCEKCNKLLFKTENIKAIIEIKCNKCKNIIIIKDYKLTNKK